MKITSRPKKICFLFHRWRIVYDNGFTIYKECIDCYTRTVTQPKNKKYRPVDLDWTFHKAHNHQLPKDPPREDI